MSENKRLGRSSLIFAGFTFISRVLGFARDVIFAHIFGASAAFDAFVIAFKIPNFFRRLFGEGAFSQAFVPVLSEYVEQRPSEVKQLLNRVMGQLALILLLVVVVCELLAPVLVYVFAPGFAHEADKFALTQHMIHITLPYLLLICLVAFSGAILNTFRHFSLAAFTPVLLNVCLIGTAYFIAPYFHQPIYAVAWGVLLAGLAQLGLQCWGLARRGLLPKPQLAWRDPGVQRIMKLMLPALFGVSVQQIGLMIDNFFASFLPTGSISWLYYSDRLTYLPLGVIGVALSTVVLPNLSRQFAQGSKEQYQRTLIWALRMAWLWAMPAALGLILLAGPLLATLIHRGAFNSFDVIMTQRSLMAFAVGLPAFMLIKILASAFYATKNIKRPVKVAAVALVVNIALNFVFIHPLAHAGLALASSIAALANASLLAFFLWKTRLLNLNWRKMPVAWRIGLASAVMFVLLWHFSPATPVWLGWSEWTRIAHLIILMALGGASYFATLWLIGAKKQMFVNQDD